MKRMMKLATVGLGLVALLATGCGGGGGDDKAPAGPDPIDKTCKSNSDCKTGQDCDLASGNCYTAGTTDCTNDPFGCPSGQECLGGFCSTVAPDCTADADCGAGNYCSGGNCYKTPVVTPPTSDTVSTGCQSASDCAPGKNCVDGYCVTPGPTTDTGQPPADTNVLPPPIDTGGPPPSTSTCNTVLNCVNQCNPADAQACMAACLGVAPPEVQQQFNAMVQCQQGCPGEQAGTVDIACMMDTCFDAAHACLGNPGQELDCNGVFTCLNACPQTDQSCPALCLLSAKDKASFDSFFAIIDCIQEACPTDPNADPNDPAAQACVQAATGEGGECFDELAACMGGGPLPGGKPGIFLYQRFFQWLMDWDWALLAHPIH